MGKPDATVTRKNLFYDSILVSPVRRILRRP